MSSYAEIFKNEFSKDKESIKLELKKRQDPRSYLGR